MKKNLNLIYNILISISITALIVGTICTILEPGSDLVRFFSTKEALIGTVLLFIFISMKSLYLLLNKRDNQFIHFLRVNNTFQREQGILVFILIFSHIIIEIIKAFGNTSLVIFEISTIVIPTCILIYMIFTTFRYTQKRIKKWKLHHTVIWIAVPLIIIHIYLVSELEAIYLGLAIFIFVIALIELIFNNKRGKKHVIYYCLGLLFSVLTFFGITSIQQANKPTPAPTPAPSSTTNGYKDGTYTGTGQGFEGSIEVSMTITNGVISDFQVTNENESQPRNSFSTISSEVISANSCDVQTVSGATYSSNGVINACNDALNQAK